MPNPLSSGFSINNTVNTNNQMNQFISELRNINKMLNSVKDPNMIINQVANQNPKLRSLLSLCNGDIQQAVRMGCQQQGIDINQLFSNLRNVLN